MTDARSAISTSTETPETTAIARPVSVPDDQPDDDECQRDQIEHRDRGAHDRPPRSRRSQADANVVAPAPELAEEHVPQRAGIAEVHVVKAGVGHQRESLRAQLAAQIDVFAGFERGVEAADALERRASDGHVAAAQPGDGFLGAGVAAQTVIQPLDPCRGRRRPAGCPHRGDLRVGQDTDRGGNPAGANFMVGVHEGQHVSARRLHGPIAQFAEPEIRQHDHGRAGLARHRGGFVRGSVVSHDDFNTARGVRAGGDASQAVFEPPRVVSHRDDE